MRYTVLTCMNLDILQSTGREMLCSLMRWPRDVRIVVAYEGPESEAVAFQDEFGAGNVELHPMLQRDPELSRWLEVYGNHPGQDSFRFCARRFAFKVFAVTWVGLHYDTDVLIWLDADTYTYAPVSIEDIETWIPGNRNLSYLGRKGSTSECGFVAYRTSDQVIRRMLSDWRQIYTTGEIFKLREWHDCFSFDHVREKWIDRALALNLTPWGRNYDHVFINGPLGKRMDHMKGNRKAAGRSRRHDVIAQHVSDEFLEYLARP